MRELQFLINDVRQRTDNTDTNAVSDREIIGYFNDCVKSIQSICSKANVLSSYFKSSIFYPSPVADQELDLPSDVFGDNAVTYVDISSDASGSPDSWSTLERISQEEGHYLTGWYTRNKKIVFTGTRGANLGYGARAWYFKRLPRWDKAWATFTSKIGQAVTINVLDSDFSKIDRFITFINPLTNEVRASGLSYVVTAPGQITVTGDVSSLVAGDLMLMGKISTIDIELPEEVEPYILDYVGKRIYGRNNYREDATQNDYFTADDRDNITSIFADAGKSIVHPPITDTSYLKV